MLTIVVECDGTMLLAIITCVVQASEGSNSRKNQTTDKSHMCGALPAVLLCLLAPSSTCSTRSSTLRELPQLNRPGQLSGGGGSNREDGSTMRASMHTERRMSEARV